MKLIKNKQTQLIEFAFDDDNTTFTKEANSITINNKKWITSNPDKYVEIVIVGENVPDFFVPNAYWYYDGWVESGILKNAWLNVRKQRDQLLRESDWTQLPDVTVANKTQWDTYRQTLRDLPNVSSNPFAIVWPNDPNYVDPAIV